MLTVKKQRRGQWQEEAEALFANYLFVHFNPDQLSVTRVQATRGVARLVRFGETLARVPDEVLIDLARRYNPLVALPEEGKVCSQPMCTALQQALVDIERESSGEVRALRFCNYCKIIVCWLPVTESNNPAPRHSNVIVRTPVVSVFRIYKA
ncbi:hypothetical protein PCI56_17280 [Plesiomonas shigelloides subsp. oncorhynchi]|nr:hypothetical protein [Plesiomonas shigelloides]